MRTTAIRSQPDDRNFEATDLMAGLAARYESARRRCGALQASPFLVQERLKLKPNRKWDPLRPVRVRRDPPTLEEAVVAAQGLSDDIEQQVEIASGLMGIPQEEVRPVIASAPPSERGFERSSRAMPQVVVLRRRGVR